jgi:Zn-dependent protease with chaperone function
VDRECVLALLVVLFGGAAALLGGAWPVRRQEVQDARRLERLRWRDVWVPLWPAAAVLTALVGWALMEPEPAEAPPPVLAVMALPFLLVWARALVQGIRRLRAPVGDTPAATVGLIRPRIFLSPRFVEALDAEALHAVREHELAHVRHRDPLRVWLAELAADLQWPLPAAQTRLVAWRRALELARDDEARRAGTDGADLAAAIVAAARIARRPVGGVALTDASAFEGRIRRLLDPLPPLEEPTRSERALSAFCAAGLLATCCAGLTWGESVVQGLFGP